MTDTTEVERHPLFGTDVVRATDYDALAAKLATCEKYRDAYAECDRIGTQSVRDLEAKLAEQIEWVKRLADDLIAAEGREAKLKAKLAEAVEALESLVRDCEADYPPSHGAIKYFARTTLAELEGQNDE